MLIGADGLLLPSNLGTYCWECLYEGAVIECNAPNNIWQNCKNKPYTRRNWSHSPGELQLTQEQSDKFLGLPRPSVIILDECINLFPEPKVPEKMYPLYLQNRVKDMGNKIIKTRWVTGITLKRYFGFTETQMRKLRKEVGKQYEIESEWVVTTKWLYDLDEVLKNHKPKTTIPEHLIKEE